MNFPGPGVYTDYEERLAVTRGERLKAAGEEPWLERPGSCLAVPPDSSPAFPCHFTLGHKGPHSWEPKWR